MKSPLFLSPKAGSLWPLNTCLKACGGSFTRGTPQGSQETLAWWAHTRLRVSKANTWLHGISCRVAGERLGSLEPIPRMPTMLSACTVTTVTNKRKPQSSGCARRGNCGLRARPQSLPQDVSHPQLCLSFPLCQWYTGTLASKLGTVVVAQVLLFGEGRAFAIWPQLCHHTLVWPESNPRG